MLCDQSCRQADKQPRKAAIDTRQRKRERGVITSDFVWVERQNNKVTKVGVNDRYDEKKKKKRTRDTAAPRGCVSCPVKA